MNFDTLSGWLTRQGLLESMADMFGHLFAALPAFGLRAFQDPGGHDFQKLIGQHD